jgi:hypothetical protein
MRVNRDNTIRQKCWLLGVFPIFYPFLVNAGAIVPTNSPLNIDNPIVLQRADPWIAKDPKTGCYQFIGTSP